jgi:hypothetical protein
MKTKLIFLSAALVISEIGCEQKSGLDTPPPASGKSTTQTIRETIGQKNAVPTEAARTLAKTVESSKNIPAADAKETTEQSLTEVSKRSREVSKTQESQSRNHAQNAEEEMLKDFEKSK